MRHTIRHLPPVALAILLAGCSLAPPYVAPAAPVPESWPVGDAYLQQAEAELPAVRYTDVFRDPRLLALAEQAIANNRDLRIAAANIEAARASARVARAGQLPQLNATGSADFSEGGAGTGQSFSVLGNMSSFELDLFGRLANTTAAARDRALATEAASRAVRITLVADLAAAWSAYAADRELLAIARDTVANAKRSVELTQVRLQGGIAPRTDVRQAEQVLATAESDVALQTTALAQDENLIRLLVGAEFDRALLPGTLAEVSASTAVLAAGTNSQVLLRRPDIIEAEYRLRATNADIGAARARLFPTISLTGLLGFTSDALRNLFSGDQFRASGGVSGSQPLFDGGSRGANVNLTEAQRDAALATYERAIQTAFREVADALAVQGTLAERLRTARVNSEAAADTARLTEARYRGGIDSFLANLDAQRSLYTARRREVEIDLAAIGNRVALYRALGTAPSDE